MVDLKLAMLLCNVFAKTFLASMQHTFAKHCPTSSWAIVDVEHCTWILRRTTNLKGIDRLYYQKNCKVFIIVLFGAGLVFIIA